MSLLWYREFYVRETLMNSTGTVHPNEHQKRTT